MSYHGYIRFCGGRYYLLYCQSFRLLPASIVPRNPFSTSFAVFNAKGLHFVRQLVQAVNQVAREALGELTTGPVGLGLGF